MSYTKNTWASGDVITAARLNHLEDGVATASAEAENAKDDWYQVRVHEATTKSQVDTLFAAWWGEVYTAGADKCALLNRWFSRVLVDERVHGVKLPLFATSQSSDGVLTDDSVGLTCTPSTAATAGTDDFARLPQFWILEVSAEKDANGAMVVYKIQHIDPISEVRSGEHLCQVLTKNTYWREWQADGYHYYRQQCQPFDGAVQWQGENPDGYHYAFAAWPKYMAGWTDSTKTALTCGTGLHPAVNKSHEDGIDLWRARNAGYCGGSYRLLKWQMAMFALKYARKGNSGLIEGCSTYNLEYKAAISETGVTRVLVTTAQAANLLVGSSVCVGDRGGVCVRITSIETVEVEGTSYGAVNLDTDVAFNTVADTTYLRTMPWYSGRCDGVLGNDGSYTNNANGKEPGMIQGTEFGVGCYQIVADQFLNWTQDGSDYYLDVYTCADPRKATKNSLTADYVKSSVTITAPASDGWQYIQDTEAARCVWPKAIGGGASNSNGCRAALYVYRGSGLRSAWAFANLNNGGLCGLAALNSGNRVGGRNWNGSPGAPTQPTQICIGSTQSNIASCTPRLCARIA